MMRKRALGELEPFLDFAVVESWKLFQLFARGWINRRDCHYRYIVPAAYEGRLQTLAEGVTRIVRTLTV